jgi:hypothetical protein
MDRSVFDRATIKAEPEKESPVGRPMVVLEEAHEQTDEVQEPEQEIEAERNLSHPKL